VYLVSVLVLLVYLVSISVTGENSAHTYLLEADPEIYRSLGGPQGNKNSSYTEAHTSNIVFTTFLI
jgi:hypothetical protein